MIDVLLSTKCLILLIIPTVLDILLITYVICCFQVKFSSINTPPKNLVLCICFTFSPSSSISEKFNFSFFFFDFQAFLIFRVSLFTLSQVTTFLNSCSTISCNFFKSLSERNKFVSSANSINDIISEHLCISLI